MGDPRGPPWGESGRIPRDHPDGDGRRIPGDHPEGDGRRIPGDHPEGEGGRYRTHAAGPQPMGEAVLLDKGC